MPDLTLAEVLSWDEPEQREETRTFRINGKDWDFVLRCDGLSSAERFYDLALAMRAYDQPAKGKPKHSLPVVIHLPNGKGRISVNNPAYLGSVALLSLVTVKPAFNFEEWLIFGHKAGGKAMDEVLAWATEMNGLNDEAITEDREEAGEASGPEASREPSSGPA